MASGGMRADTAVMGETGNLATDTAEQLNGMMNSLMTRLAPLEEHFRGVAGSSFRDVKAAFDEDMARLNIALHAIAEAISTSGRDLELKDADLGEAMWDAHAEYGQITRALSLNPGD